MSLQLLIPPGTGGGPASGTGADQQVIVRVEEGPAVYPSGGFVLDLSTWLASLNLLWLVTVAGSRGVLPACDLEVALDSPGAGMATVRVLRLRHDRLATVDGAAGQPAGVALAAAAGETVTAEAAHAHPIDHDHSGFASGINTTGGGQVLLDVLGPALEQHTHVLDLPSLTGTSGAGGSHDHIDSSIYEHGHDLTLVETDMAWVELAAGTDLSATRWRMLALGVSV